MIPVSMLAFSIHSFFVVPKKIIYSNYKSSKENNFALATLHEIDSP